MSVHKPQGSIYLFPSVKESGLTSFQAVRRLLEKAHVLTMPGELFGQAGEGFLRISYAYSIDNLKKALDKIEKFIDTLN